MTYTDENALKSLKIDDKEADQAFTWIYKKYFHLLWSYAVKFVKVKEDAKDIVNGLFSNLWVNRETIEIAELKPYLYGSIRNNCLKHLEHIEVWRKYSEDAMHLTGISDDNDNPLSMLIAKEETDKIEEAMGALPEMQRKVMLLRKDEYSYQEIAEELDTSISAVKIHLHRARVKMRKSIENKG